MVPILFAIKNDVQEWLCPYIFSVDRATLTYENDYPTLVKLRGKERFTLGVGGHALELVVSYGYIEEGRDGRITVYFSAEQIQIFFIQCENEPTSVSFVPFTWCFRLEKRLLSLRRCLFCTQFFFIKLLITCVLRGWSFVE